jgi:predicted small lipoprotein YifL
MRRANTTHPRLLPVFIVILAFAAVGCVRKGPAGQPPDDPIAEVPARDLFRKGLGHGRRGDLTRAEQYLSAALLKGYPKRDARLPPARSS